MATTYWLSASVINNIPCFLPEKRVFRASIESFAKKILPRYRQKILKLMKDPVIKLSASRKSFFWIPALLVSVL